MGKDRGGGEKGLAHASGEAGAARQTAYIEAAAISAINE
ncbi:hypothetical protein RLDS_23945 [Sphingobium lactosutens DS20]|uniref:Uncharacterized protein n=1 Tax=Sphingobium lactosutens DS20 TaxID=1331060 RepID=T0II97_9SPHN|nr:hypothetical protein RLDS_23945 [Sphingobium lactosutens DS20]